MNFKIVDFQCFTDYSAMNIEHFITSCDSFSYLFNSGVYILNGDIDSGAIAFSYSLTPNCKNKIIFDDTKFYINKKFVQLKDIQKISCYLNNYSFLSKFITCRQAFMYISKNSNFNLNDILNSIGFPKYLLDRKVSQLSSYSMMFYAVYYYILGKKIIVMPWMNKRNVDITVLEKILNFYKDKDCILLACVSRQLGKDLQKINCVENINFNVY